MLDVLKRFDESLGYPLRTGKRRVNRTLDLARYARDQRRRRQQYPDVYDPGRADPEVIAALARDGVAVVPGAIDTDVLARLKAAFERELDDGRNLVPSPDDSRRTEGDRENASRKLSAEEMQRGQEFLRHHTHRATLADPMVRLPATADLSIDRRLFDIASAYLSSVPAVGSVTLRKSYVNDLPAFDTLLYHVDPNCPRFLKFFIYLDDVDEGSGPFRYVRGSHRDRHRGWLIHQRWHEDEIVAAYGREALFDATAAAGDLVVADTTGFHRGTKPRTRDRWMLTISYVVAPEYGGQYPRNRVSRAALERGDGLTGWRRAASDFLDPVEEPAPAA